MPRLNTVFGLLALISLPAASARGDIRNLSWKEVTTSTTTACLGRVVALYALESKAGYPSILATVVTSDTVRALVREPSTSVPPTSGKCSKLPIALESSTSSFSPIRLSPYLALASTRCPRVSLGSASSANPAMAWRSAITRRLM